jgi:acyl-CoA thioesterase
MKTLDESLKLEPAGEGRWRAAADPAREANSGMFGGWTAALLLKAVLDDPRSEGSASAITVSYIRRVPAGAALLLRSHRLGGGKSLSHWRCDLSLEGDAEIVAAASIVLADRRESDRFTEGRMPEAPEPGALHEFNPPGPFGASMEMRVATGADPFDQPTTRTLAWEREKTGRPLDALQVVYLSDVGWPRVFALGASPRPSSTVTLSVYIHATTEELAACGDDYILSDMTGTRVEHSTVGSNARLWSRAGALLATTEQLCWFR